MRCVPEWSEDVLLERLLRGCSSRYPDYLKEHDSIYVCSDSSWVHLIDDLSYTTDGLIELRSRLDELGKRFDVFYGSLGDWDRSYDFTVHRSGKIVRREDVDDPRSDTGRSGPGYVGLYVHESIGDLLRPEQALMQAVEEGRVEDPDQDRLLAIASYLGVDLNHRTLSVRTLPLVSLL
ncbi:MAG: hypothetical protein AAF196_08055 [Planctomycetota bacterium]